MTDPRHWRRAQGRLVAVTPVEGDEFTGRVVTSDDATATLDVAGDERQVPYAEVAVAVMQIEFGSSTAKEG